MLFSGIYFLPCYSYTAFPFSELTTSLEQFLLEILNKLE
jgi:hypothetical protein